MSMNIFRKAASIELRIQTSRGAVTVEDLFTLPLTGEYSLDALAKLVNKRLKESEEESFVKVVAPVESLDSLRLDILKDIIAQRLEEKELRENAVLKKAKKAKLVRLLAKRQDETLDNLSEEDILKQLDEL